MRPSLTKKVVLAVSVSLAGGLLASVYILNKFHTYESDASRLMSGDQKALVTGHLIDSRLKALEELARVSSGSEQEELAFRERSQSVLDELKTIPKDRQDKSIEQVHNEIFALVTEKTSSVEDLFVQYRNLKTGVFNLYRLSWGNKWMTLAKTMGLIQNDLENVPYAEGAKAVPAVFAKINQVTALVARSNLGSPTKLMIFNQLTGIKNQLTRYAETAEKIKEQKTKRAEAVKKAAGLMKKFNEANGKGMLEFAHTAHAEFFKGVVVFLLYLLFAMAWYAWSVKGFAARVTAVTTQIGQQFAAWLTPSGSVSAQGYQAPDDAELEFIETYQAFDQIIRRVNGLRKEDLLVKRLLNVPFLLVHRSKNAIFWNSALSIMGKVRALEETGSVPYSNLLMLVDGHSKPVDPVGAAIQDSKEVAQLCLMRVGDDTVAVLVSCTPVLGSDHQVEYVMVHIRDLREEKRRTEIEVDRQTVIVKEAIETVRSGKLPTEPQFQVRPGVLECVKALKSLAIELDEKDARLGSQAETMRARINREASLKRSIHGRMSQFVTEVHDMKKQLLGLKQFTENLAARLLSFDSVAMELHSEYEEIRKRGTTLVSDLKLNEDLIAASLGHLKDATQMVTQVRSQEKLIKNLLEQSSVLNSNNSIMGARKELSPAEVSEITENISRLINQFDRNYRFIEQNVKQVDEGLSLMSEKLNSNLSACARLVEDDRAMLDAVYSTDKAVFAATKQRTALSKELQTFKDMSAKIMAQLQGFEAKVKRMEEIGAASLSLQEQLELGFRGLMKQTGVDGQFQSDPTKPSISQKRA